MTTRNLPGVRCSLMKERRPAIVREELSFHNLFYVAKERTCPHQSEQFWIEDGEPLLSAAFVLVFKGYRAAPLILLVTTFPENKGSGILSFVLSTTPFFLQKRF